jgi:cytosine/uracil/thiamine/allantoin permease
LATSSAQKERAFSISRLLPAEYGGFLAAAVLFVSLFLTWFSTNGPNGSINGETGEFNAWNTFNSLDYLLAAACIAPFILAYIIVRGHELSWRPGEVTAIVGIIAFVLILCNGVILGKPGNPPGEIAFGIGYPIALVASFGILVSGFLRQGQNVKRKPPGV